MAAVVRIEYFKTSCGLERWEAACYVNGTEYGRLTPYATRALAVDAAWRVWGTAHREAVCELIDAIATEVFRSSFQATSHQASSQETACEMARQATVAMLPLGVVGVFDDEQLTFVADRSV
jgi:hypothetical protein